MTQATLPRTTPPNINPITGDIPFIEPAPATAGASTHSPLVGLTPVDDHGYPLLPTRLARVRHRSDGQLEASKAWPVEGPVVIARCRVTDRSTGHSWIEELDHGIARIDPGRRTIILIRVWWQP